MVSACSLQAVDKRLCALAASGAGCGGATNLIVPPAYSGCPVDPAGNKALLLGLAGETPGCGWNLVNDRVAGVVQRTQHASHHLKDSFDVVRQF
jgi:hypothetical protein